MAIIPRMETYVNQSTPVHPQKRYAPSPAGGMNPRALEAFSKYLETVNLHDRAYWAYQPKAFPRPKGAATHVIYTEYQLPRAVIEPHDVYVNNGTVWYSYFGEQYIGKLDPATGKVTEYPIPTMKKGWPTGTLDLQPDKAGNLWLSGMYQGGLFEFNPKTETAKAWPLPADMNTVTAQQSMVMPNNMNVDGEVWTNNQDVHKMLKLDVNTGAVDRARALPRSVSPRPPGLGVRNPLRLEEQRLLPRLRPQRSGDRQARCQDRANDDVRNADHRLVGAPRPHRRERPHDVRRIRRQPGRDVRHDQRAVPRVADADAVDQPLRRDDGQERRDLDRLDVDRPDRPVEHQDRMRSTEYLLPHFTNIRRVFVDNTTTPVTFWAGNNHAASIVKLEPLP